MTKRVPIQVEVPATEATFEETGYLTANPDVRKAVRDGIFGSGLEHFRLHGFREDRKIALPRSNLEEARAAKLAALAPHLRLDLPHRFVDGRYDFLSDDLRRLSRIEATENESANGYDEEMQALVAAHAEGLCLDCGAGRRQVYYPNVVNFEIAAYDTTDVLGVGEALPFRDAAFDLVFSVAVLEHVRDPFLCANEICRVLKPGGQLFCAMPFLQPLHGYPHHYFNATKQGLRRLFEDRLRVDRVSVPETGHPAYALHWFLENWTLGLDPAALAAFRALSVGELVDMEPARLKREPFGGLAEARVDELASGFLLRAVRVD